MIGGILKRVEDKELISNVHLEIVHQYINNLYLCDDQNYGQGWIV